MYVRLLFSSGRILLAYTCPLATQAHVKLLRRHTALTLKPLRL